MYLKSTPLSNKWVAKLCQSYRIFQVFFQISFVEAFGAVESRSVVINRVFSASPADSFLFSLLFVDGVHLESFMIAL
jgi:hypothetical protein